MKTTHSSAKLPFFLIALLIGFPQISETIYSPSLPSIAADLSVSAHWVEWTLSVYFIGFALGVGLWGILADRFGRRPIMLIGIVLYCLATLGCQGANHIGWLLLWRVVQALGASVGSVITQTMIRDLYTGNEKAKLFSLLGIPLSLAPALGPLIGTWLDTLFDWRANFTALFILGVGVLFLSSKWLPETKPHNTTMVSWQSLCSLAKRLCKDKKVFACTIIVSGVNGILFGFYAEAPFLLMETMGLSANLYGWIGLAIALGGLLGSMISHRLQQKLTSLHIIGLGCTLMLLSCVAMMTLAYGGLLTSEYVGLGSVLLMFCMFCCILGGMGLAIPNVVSIALTDYQQELGRAGSLFGLAYYVLIALMVALIGALHDGTVFVMPWYFLALSALMLLVFYHYLLVPAKAPQSNFS